ncbi:hypothetical protein EPN52_15165 [bacterium]|nr:MAG: hypothetical protein EPN52_15165 [bacterium]
MAQLLRGSMWIGRCFGIRVGIHPSWLLVFALAVWMLSESFGDLGAMYALSVSVITALALFGSVVVHEFAHALIARRFGVATLSVRLFLFGGVATIAAEPPTPGAEAAIAVAGPLCSAALAGLCALALEAMRHLGGEPHLALVLMALAAANAFLAAFNLLPAFPMDGGRIFRAAVWRLRGDRAAATRLSSLTGMAFALALGLLGMELAWQTHDWEPLWYVALGGFVSIATIQSYQDARCTRCERVPGGSGDAPQRKPAA